MSTYHFELEVITPVHIGMGKERDYIRGLDYHYNPEKKEYTIINQDRFLNTLPKKEINAISSFLSGGDFDKFDQYIKNKKLLSEEMVTYKWQSDYDAYREIKKHIQDGMGHWIIPGSSIKGSIRGILLSYLYHQLKARPKTIDEQDLLGGIDNNLMRFVQVSDCIPTTTPGIYPIKIFSADPNFEGNWKHKRTGGHSPEFIKDGFVTFYEMLTDGVNSKRTLGEFRINWGVNEFLYYKRENSVPNMKQFFLKNNISSLITIIQKHTNDFLEKEISFFKSYPNTYLTEENFFNELKWLSDENKKDAKSCILRLGANEGWHSITGDWKFDNFVNATENNRTNMVGKIQKAYKTRKILFDWDDDNDAPNHRRFALPGFVKMTLQAD